MISLTVSLIAVFIPLLFMTGLVGRMFREFALTLTIAVVVSAIVSLTLTPMMCSRLLRHTRAHAAGALARRVQRRWSSAPSTSIGRSLEWVLRHQTATLVVTFATLAATIALYIVIPKGFLPPQDTGLITAVTEAGQEVSFVEMQRLQAQVVDAIRKDPDVTGVVSIAGVTRINATPNAGRLAITLKPRDERRDFVTEIVERLKQAVAPIPGMQVYLPARSGHPDRHATEPRAISVHAGRNRRERGADLGRAACAAAAVIAAAARRRLGGAGRRLADARSMSIARRPAGSASRCRSSTTRSTMRSGSGRFRPSTARPTSTG